MTVTDGKEGGLEKESGMGVDVRTVPLLHGGRELLSSGDIFVIELGGHRLQLLREGRRWILRPLGIGEILKDEKDRGLIWDLVCGGQRAIIQFIPTGRRGLRYVMNRSLTVKIIPAVLQPVNVASRNGSSNGHVHTHRRRNGTLLRNGKSG